MVGTWNEYSGKCGNNRLGGTFFKNYKSYDKNLLLYVAEEFYGSGRCFVFETVEYLPIVK